MQPYFSQSRLIREPKDPSRARVEAFRRQINRKHGLTLKDYFELQKYSISDYAFWQDLWEYEGIIYSTPPAKVVAEGRMKECPEWFPGARLNYAENILRHDSDAIACTTVRETGEIIHYTFKQLKHRVREMAAAMRVSGLQVGDRVAAILTNAIDAIVIGLAAGSIGAIYSSSATDMGEQAILDRYRQIQPRFLFSETEVVYGGKSIDLMPKVTAIVTDLTSQGLERVILLPSTRTKQDVRIPAGRTNCSTMCQFLSMDDGRALAFEQLPFSHPAYILYSSGTSGPPKCIVHSGMGVFMNNVKEGAFAYDFCPNDVYLQFTTTGWMMWNSMIQMLALGVRIICYDGSPFYPSVRSFVKLVDDLGVTTWGTGPRFLAEVRGAGIEPLSLGSFDALQFIFSGGAVLTAPMFEWAQQAFGPRVHVASGAGGTDICGGFLSIVPSLPTYSGEIQAKSLGLAIEVFDPDGNSIEDTGMPGEMVCTRPHPSLPNGFWEDKSNEKFRKAYFNMYPGVWCQSDFLVKNPRTQGFLVLGRSDGVLNPNGVRFGSAEIYSILERFRDELDESLCVGQRRPEDQDERVLLFLKLRPGHQLNNSLTSRIRQAIRKGLSSRHVPAYIFQVEDIPYTVNGKKIEIAVKQIVSGSTLKPSGTVANPESLQLYYKYRNLEQLPGIAAKTTKARL